MSIEARKEKSLEKTKMMHPTLPEASQHEPISQKNERACPSNTENQQPQPTNSEPTLEQTTTSKEDDVFYWAWSKPWGKEAADVIWEWRNTPNPEEQKE